MYNNIYILYKLVLANCMAYVCYFMIVDYNDIYKYIYLYIYIYIYIYVHIYINNK